MISRIKRKLGINKAEQLEEIRTLARSDRELTSGECDRFEILTMKYGVEKLCKTKFNPHPDADGICWMIVAKVAMGHYRVATRKLEGIRRPPCREKCRNKRCKHKLYDSVLAVTKKTHPKAYLKHSREFVIYDRRQCVPVLLVGVKRVESVSIVSESTTDSSTSDSYYYSSS